MHGIIGIQGQFCLAHKGLKQTQKATDLLTYIFKLCFLLGCSTMQPATWERRRRKEEGEGKRKRKREEEKRGGMRRELRKRKYVALPSQH